MDDQILSLEHISLSYHTMKGETPALCDLTFSVNPGEFVALVGPSGCGKSTILNLISGLLKPEAGTLLSRGRPITEADLHIGYMLQRDHLFEWRTIYSNVLLGLEISRTLTPERKEKVGEMMETYGLKSFSNARPSELSGGMRQRAALIRTLAMEPDLLLLDEPFSALDYQTRLNVCDDIGKIIKKEGKTAKEKRRKKEGRTEIYEKISKSGGTRNWCMHDGIRTCRMRRTERRKRDENRNETGGCYGTGFRAEHGGNRNNISSGRTGYPDDVGSIQCECSIRYGGL